MKSIFREKNGMALWLVFHCGVLIFFLARLFLGGVQFQTSLFDILPSSSALRDVQAADSALAGRTSRSVIVLAKSPDFDQARGVAAKLYESCSGAKNARGNAYFDEMSLFVDFAAVSALASWVYEYRYQLLSDSMIARLESGNAALVAQEAIETSYSPFLLSDLSNLETDPFLLTESELHAIVDGGAATSTAFAPKGDVLSAHKDGFWYVLVRAVLSESGASLSFRDNGVKKIRRECERLSSSDVAFVFSGVPFHSAESAENAQRQISVISSVGLFLVFVMFLLVFRSIVRSVASVVSVSISCLMGLMMTVCVFGKIHVLTFVFGTTLIGTCLDYSIHFFVHWKKNHHVKTSFFVRDYIFRGITLGFVSSELCFAALFFAPFPFLKQTSIFLFSGLLSSYLSVVFVYPILKKPKAVVVAESKGASRVFVARSAAWKRGIRFVPIFLFVASSVVLIVRHDALKIKNSVSGLYSMSPFLMENEREANQVMNAGSYGWYFIIKAQSAEQLLEKNESFSAVLDEARLEGKLEHYLSVSQFVPSPKKQKRSYEACRNLLPLARTQLSSFGIDSAADFLEDFSRREHNLILLDGGPSGVESLPESVRSALSSVWIGNIGGDFYSCVIPLHATDEAYFRRLVEKNGMDGVYFVNKATDISVQLDELSRSMLMLLAAAFALVVLVLAFCYPRKTVAVIAFVPLLVTCVTLGVLLLCHIPVSFFPITALVLVFGLGLDYIIYAVEGAKNGADGRLNTQAVLLSFVTTALSFGALALSDFVPVHMIGLTVFAGLTTAAVSALLAQLGNIRTDV